MRGAHKAANQACATRYADVVPCISTNATVRDLDRLREAVGDAQLTYWGTSYGTRIGYVYAHDRLLLVGS
jgi:pimeloyl-ACP methyl ester carboxylesterase